MLSRTYDVNLQINVENLRLCLQAVPYMEHIVTTEWLRLDLARITAMLKMKRGTDVQELGFVNYLFQPLLMLLADVCEPLRCLTDKCAIFTWQSQQEEVLEKVKNQ